MQNLADIAGANTTAPLSTVNVTARWVQFIAIGSGTARIGGSTVSATVGLPLVASTSGVGMFLPVQGADGLSQSPYSLNALYAYVPTGVTLSVAYEPFN